MKLNYTTKDIVTVVVIAVINGLIGAGWGYVFNIAAAVPTIGGILGAAINFVWFVGPLVAFYLIRKPGVAAATQLLSGVVSVLAGHPAGVIAYGWYVLEAIGAEAGFAIFGYKRWDVVALSVAGLLQGINFAWSLFYFSIYNYGLNAWLWPWLFTFLTAWVAGPIALAIGKALGRTGLYAMDARPQSSTGQ
jgi:energy-coupling factor transport system substrate-specific component